MEKIIDFIEVTKADIEELRYRQEASKIAKDEKMIEKLEKQIREEICVLSGVRTALTFLEEDNGK